MGRGDPGHVMRQVSCHRMKRSSDGLSRTKAATGCGRPGTIEMDGARPGGSTSTAFCCAPSALPRMKLPPRQRG